MARDKTEQIESCVAFGFSCFSLPFFVFRHQRRPLQPTDWLLVLFEPGIFEQVLQLSCQVSMFTLRIRLRALQVTLRVMVSARPVLRLTSGPAAKGL
jgi:hypothetical protein